MLGGVEGAAGREEEAVSSISGKRIRLRGVRKDRKYLPSADAFIHWLALQDEDAVVGWTRNPDQCPLAMGSGLEITYQGWSGLKLVGESLPTWAWAFTHIVDGWAPESVPVTAQEALRVMRSLDATVADEESLAACGKNTWRKTRSRELGYHSPDYCDRKCQRASGRRVHNI